MVPFVRTLSEARQVTKLLAENGLERGVERPARHHDVRAADQRAARRAVPRALRRHLDRLQRHDAAHARRRSRLGDRRASFDERDDAVKALLSIAIAACRKHGKYIGICGQGPSDHPDFARWLVEQGIDSISLNPDTVVETWLMLRRGNRRQSTWARSANGLLRVGPYGRDDRDLGPALLSRFEGLQLDSVTMPFVLERTAARGVVTRIDAIAADERRGRSFSARSSTRDRAVVKQAKASSSTSSRLPRPARGGAAVSSGACRRAGQQARRPTPPTRRVSTPPISRWRTTRRRNARLSQRGRGPDRRVSHRQDAHFAVYRVAVRHLLRQLPAHGEELESERPPPVRPSRQAAWPHDPPGTPAADTQRAPTRKPLRLARNRCSTRCAPRTPCSSGMAYPTSTSPSAVLETVAVDTATTQSIDIVHVGFLHASVVGSGACAALRPSVRSQ